MKKSKVLTFPEKFALCNNFPGSANSKIGKAIFAVFILLCLSLTACSPTSDTETNSSKAEDIDQSTPTPELSNTPTPESTPTPTNSPESSSAKNYNETQDSELTFTPITDEEALSLISAGAVEADNVDKLVNPILLACNEIGVKETKDAQIGNYEENSGVYFIDVKFATEKGITLLANAMYISFTANPEWSGISIKDFNTGHWYYIPEGSEEMVDLYSYETGELIEPAEQQQPSGSNASSEKPVPFSLESGVLLDANPDGGPNMNTLIIKAKISSNLTNRLTITQNYLNIIQMIQERDYKDYTQYDSIDYWAIADMVDGTERKVISFTVDKNCIEAIANGSIASADTLEENLADLWILPSLQEK